MNSSLVAYSVLDPVTLNISRTINEGEYNLTIFADAGTQTYTISNIRYVVTAEGLVYDYSQVTFSGGGASYYTDYITYEAEEQLPPGAYISSDIVLMLILGIFVGFPLAYVLLMKWELLSRIRFRENN